MRDALDVFYCAGLGSAHTRGCEDGRGVQKRRGFRVWRAGIDGGGRGGNGAGVT
jgi:hypothetical protein